MLLFLASVLEQLDVAVEHVSKADVHNARFSLMLSDNAVELVLHQIAKSQASELKAWSHLRKSYPHTEALQKATGRNFDAKVRFARLEGKLTDEMAQSISVLHTYRNEVYHVGLQHESILSALARFHLVVACKFAASFDPGGLSYGSNTRLPERSKKYLGHSKHYSLETINEYRKGCDTLAALSGHDDRFLIDALADHMDEIVGHQDTCLDIVAAGVYEGQQTTRDQAIIDSQAWTIAFSEAGKNFALEKGWSKGSVLDFVNWVAANYPLDYRGDPIPSWRKRAAALRAEENPHSALNRYHSFMVETAALREAMVESAGAAEAEIDAGVERMRYERAVARERGK